MSTKIRRDLPTTSEGGKWSEDDIRRFDPYRERYKKLVEIAERCDKDKAYISDVDKNPEKWFQADYVLQYYSNWTKSRTSDDLHEQFVFSEIMDYDDKTAFGKTKSSVQRLNKINIENIHYLDHNNADDIATALYIPSHLRWIRLSSTLYWGAEWSAIPLFEFDGTMPEEDISDILKKARKIPKEKISLDELLIISHAGKIGFIHTQEDKIHIDGEDYIRIVPIQPLLPLSTTKSTICIEVSESCTIYMESATISGKVYDEITEYEDLCLFSEDKAGRIIIWDKEEMLEIIGSHEWEWQPSILDESGSTLPQIVVEPIKIKGEYVRRSLIIKR